MRHLEEWRYKLSRKDGKPSGGGTTSRIRRSRSRFISIGRPGGIRPSNVPPRNRRKFKFHPALTNFSVSRAVYTQSFCCLHGNGAKRGRALMGVQLEGRHGEFCTNLSTHVCKT